MRCSLRLPNEGETHDEGHEHRRTHTLCIDDALNTHVATAVAVVGETALVEDDAADGD